MRTETKAIKKARIKYSVEDITLLMSNGVLAITDTIYGLVWGSYENIDGEHEFTFDLGSEKAIFDKIESARIFIQDSYSIQQ